MNNSTRFKILCASVGAFVVMTAAAAGLGMEKTAHAGPAAVTQAETKGFQTVEEANARLDEILKPAENAGVDFNDSVALERAILKQNGMPNATFDGAGFGVYKETNDEIVFVLQFEDGQFEKPIGVAELKNAFGELIKNPEAVVAGIQNGDYIINITMNADEALKDGGIVDEAAQAVAAEARKGASPKPAAGDDKRTSALPPEAEAQIAAAHEQYMQDHRNQLGIG